MKIQGLIRDGAWAAGCIALVTVSYILGGNSGRLDSLNAAVVDRVAKERLEADSAYKQSVESVKANQGKLDRLDGYEKKTADLGGQIERRKAELSTTIGKLAEGKTELYSLTRRIGEAKGRPIELPAGFFRVGRDIPPGRYSILGESNLFVKTVDGDHKVNTILGYGGVGRFVCDLEEGDEIEANGADSFYPID